MGKKITVEQVKKALQCKQYNASEHFTMDVTGLSHTSLGRIFMLKKADEQAGIDGIYRTGSAAEGLRDVVAEALGYTAADREKVNRGKVKYCVAADDNSDAEPEQLTLDDAEQQSAPDNVSDFISKVITDTLDREIKNAEKVAIYKIFERLCVCLERVEKLLEKGRYE